MLPEIIHVRLPTKMKTTFGQLPSGSFFTFSDGLFQKILGKGIVVQPLTSHLAVEAWRDGGFSDDTEVTPVRVRIEVHHEVIQ